MNRITKFRGKRTDNGNWVYGFYFKTPLTDENSGADVSTGMFFLTGITRHCISHEHGVAFTVNPKTVGEFTGLKDMNGKEIYEGDIIKYHLDETTVQTILFNTATASFDAEYPGTNEAEPLYESIEYTIVAGNIHDTPELLNPND
jgi:uncharacterized phage protein (TIGR01671 family)